MNRNDVMQELAMLCRRNTAAALWCVGYLAQGTSTEVLQEALEGTQEADKAWGHSDHMQAYEERWGRLPDRP